MAVRRDEQHRTLMTSPASDAHLLALHAKEAGLQIEHEVVPFAGVQWAAYSDAATNGVMGDRGLGNRALLIRDQLYRHVVRLENASDGAVARSGYAVAATASFGTSSQRSSRR